MFGCGLPVCALGFDWWVPLLPRDAVEYPNSPLQLRRARQGQRKRTRISRRAAARDTTRSTSVPASHPYTKLTHVRRRVCYAGSRPRRPLLLCAHPLTARRPSRQRARGRATGSGVHGRRTGTTRCDHCYYATWRAKRRCKSLLYHKSCYSEESTQAQGCARESVSDAMKRCTSEPSSSPDTREDGRMGPRPSTVRIAYGYRKGFCSLSDGPSDLTHHRRPCLR